MTQHTHLTQLQQQHQTHPPLYPQIHNLQLGIQQTICLRLRLKQRQERLPSSTKLKRPHPMPPTSPLINANNRKSLLHLHSKDVQAPYLNSSRVQNNTPGDKASRTSSRAYCRRRKQHQTTSLERARSYPSENNPSHATERSPMQTSSAIIAHRKRKHTASV